jgi:hypothetical protein
VKFRSRILWAGALGLWIAAPALADEPGRLSVKQSQVLAPTQETSANQEVANTIADHLRQSGQLRHYNIHVVFQGGSAELSGSVTDQLQRLQEPLPIGPGPTASLDLNPPHLPPYAWPTYAPYNNYSRVAYPNLYPYEAWPFIGPAYPFPKIPLGWRSVKLTWEDGHWWYSRHSNHYDWWRLRYW